MDNDTKATYFYSLRKKIKEYNELCSLCIVQDESNLKSVPFCENRNAKKLAQIRLELRNCCRYSKNPIPDSLRFDLWKILLLGNTFNEKSNTNDYNIMNNEDHNGFLHEIGIDPEELFEKQDIGEKEEEMEEDDLLLRSFRSLSSSSLSSLDDYTDDIDNLELDESLKDSKCDDTSHVIYDDKTMDYNTNTSTSTNSINNIEKENIIMIPFRKM